MEKSDDIWICAERILVKTKLFPSNPLIVICGLKPNFADAVAALEDTNRVEELDVRFVYGEERTQVIGVAHGTRAIRDRDATRRRHLQNHIGPEGHMT